MEVSDLLDVNPGKLLWLVFSHPCELPNVYPVQFVGFHEDSIAQREVVVVGPWGDGYASTVQDETCRFRAARRCSVVDVGDLYKTPTVAYRSLFEQVGFQAISGDTPCLYREFLIFHHEGGEYDREDPQSLTRCAKRAATKRLCSLRELPLFQRCEKGIL